MKNKIIKKAVIFLIWLGLWQVTAVFVKNPVYFASPFETIKELCIKLSGPEFAFSVLSSLLRILSGFFAALVSAYFLAFVSLKNKWFRDFLSPFVTFLKSVPVAAVVVILLIWWGSGYLVLCIGFMVVFPNLYGNLLMGLKKTDERMLERARAFRMPFWRQWRCIYRPAYRPYLKAGLSFSTGMCFKSGVAAEIIALPERAIGTRLYMDKIYLNTAGVFAWMAVIVFVSFLTEKVIGRIAGARAVPKVRDGSAAVWEQTDRDLEMPKIRKSYAGKEVLDLPERKVSAGECMCILGPSGSGKTTLLHILAGLLADDDGRTGTWKAGVCFQENRLWEEADARVNLWMAGCAAEDIEKIYELLPEELCKKEIKTLSGGEKRRVALARAVLFPSEILLLDEPFAGLDEDNRKRAAKWILKYRKMRPVLIATHDEEDILLLQAKSFRLSD